MQQMKLSLPIASGVVNHLLYQHQIQCNQQCSQLQSNHLYFTYDSYYHAIHVVMR